MHRISKGVAPENRSIRIREESLPSAALVDLVSNIPKSWKRIHLFLVSEEIARRRARLYWKTGLDILTFSSHKS